MVQERRVPLPSRAAKLCAEAGLEMVSEAGSEWLPTIVSGDAMVRESPISRAMRALGGVRVADHVHESPPRWGNCCAPKVRGGPGGRRDRELSA